ncbi:MAG TPA: GGDEF domain-containing protein, partial [Rhodocyclaceae bacterium]|nr:GGDEF domain-containing protein [Rhodocyclaceae bacterium]
ITLAVGTARRMLAAVDRLLDGVSRIVEKRDFGLRLEEAPPFEVAKISRGFNELLTIVDTLLAEKDYLAAVDPLTGIANRARFATVAESELERVRRYGGALSLVIFDVDRFKWINDRFGHSTGDAALRAIVSSVRDNVRAHDLLARWGGDEFVVLLPGVGIDSARTVAEKLREAVAAEAIDPIGAVSCTFGAAEYAVDDCLESLFDRADRALLTAKRQGRNQVSIAQSPLPVPAAAPAS